MQHQRPLLAAIVAMLPFHAGYALDCADGTPVSVAGDVTTMNISETQQTGQVCMKLTEASGKQVFNSCGAILGEILSRDETGGSLLSHVAAFKGGHAFQTDNDAAQVTGVTAVDASGVPCAFDVVESVTQLKWGSGIFRKGSFEITALGNVSACPDKNLNTFQLSGVACLRSGKYAK
jgi:hypothetical protein